MPQSGDGDLWPTTDDDRLSEQAGDASTHELPVPEKPAPPSWFEPPRSNGRDEPHAKPAQQRTQPMSWPVADLEKQVKNANTEAVSFVRPVSTPAWPNEETPAQPPAWPSTPDNGPTVNLPLPSAAEETEAAPSAQQADPTPTKPGDTPAPSGDTPASPVDEAAGQHQEDDAPVDSTTVTPTDDRANEQTAETTAPDKSQATQPLPEPDHSPADTARPHTDEPPEAEPDLGEPADAEESDHPRPEERVEATAPAPSHTDQPTVAEPDVADHTRAEEPAEATERDRHDEPADAAAPDRSRPDQSDMAERDDSSHDAPSIEQLHAGQPDDAASTDRPDDGQPTDAGPLDRPRAGQPDGTEPDQPHDDQPEPDHSRADQPAATPPPGAGQPDDAGASDRPRGDQPGDTAAVDRRRTGKPDDAAAVDRSRAGQPADPAEDDRPRAGHPAEGAEPGDTSADRTPAVDAGAPGRTGDAPALDQPRAGQPGDAASPDRPPSGQPADSAQRDRPGQPDDAATSHRAGTEPDRSTDDRTRIVPAVDAAALDQPRAGRPAGSPPPDRRRPGQPGDSASPDQPRTTHPADSTSPDGPRSAAHPADSTASDRPRSAAHPADSTASDRPRSTAHPVDPTSPDRPRTAHPTESTAPDRPRTTHPDPAAADRARAGQPTDAPDRPRSGPADDATVVNLLRPQPQNPAADGPTVFIRPIQPPREPDPQDSQPFSFVRPRHDNYHAPDSATVNLPRPDRKDEWPPPEPPRAAPQRIDPTSEEPPAPRRSKKLLIVAVAVVAVLGLAAGVVLGVPGLSDKLGLTGEDPVAIEQPPAPITYTPGLRGPDSNAPAPSPQGVASALAGPISNPALGTVTGVVIDPATNQTLYERDSGNAITPASTGKIITAAAALLSLDHTEQLVTKVVQGEQPGEVIIVGGGDPTISSLPTGNDGTIYPGAAHLDELVEQVRASGVQVTTVYIDQSRYTGPELAQSWLPEDIGAGYIAPIVPAMLDGDRQGDPAANYSPRTTDPGRTLVDEFAARIGASPAGSIEKKAPSGAKVLGEIRSAPMTQLVDNMLDRSENTLGDILAHEIAVRTGQDPSFDGASKAMLDVLRQNNFDVDGTVLKDGSGMSEQNKVSAKLLAQILAVAAGPDGKDPRTAKLRPLLGGLPVAGGSGTLEDRYAPGATSAEGRGWVRAKTGTLTGVNSLAGIVLDKDNRPLVFAFLTNGTNGGTARPALDTVAAALRGCGCR